MKRPTLRDRRLVRSLILGLAGETVTAKQAFADTSASSVSWSNLSAGDDWSARVLDSMFPMSSAAQTATGTMLQYISAYAMLIAAFWISYASILQVHRTAETGKILSASFSGWVPIRIITALALMVPITGNGGFSVGQAIIVQAAKAGIGMARNLNDVVASAIGPQALPLAQPIIPGTRQVVMAVMESELCRALINDASNNSALIPEPTIGTSSAGSTVTVDYSLGVGEATSAATCGGVSIVLPEPTKQQILGTSIDMSQVGAAQVQALKDVISAVRKPMGDIATTLWSTRDVTALRAMDSVLVSTDTTYSGALTTAASTMMSKLRTSSSSNDAGYAAMKNLGWSGLGAYYLEISRLNSEVLSVSSIVPSVTSPSWQGVGGYLARDLTGVVAAIKQYQAAEEAKLSASDTSGAPNGASRMFSSAQLPNSSSSTLDRVLQALGISNALLTTIVNTMISPTSGSDWTDPLAAMIGLGHLLIHIALGIIGGAALLSSKTGSAGATVGNVLTGDIPGAVASAAAFAMNDLVKALLTPVFAGAFLLMAPGITLAYVLPMMPFAFWIAGVAGWYIVVVEAVVGVPLWMLAHLVFQGEGLHGRGLRGYEVLFTIVFRPIMMIAGLVLSYTIFASMSWFVMKGFSVATGFVFDHGWLTDNLIGLVVLLCMFVTTEMSLATMSFRLISTLPHHIPAMAGMTSIGRVDSDSFADQTSGAGSNKAVENAAGMARDSASNIAGSDRGKGEVDKPAEKPVDSTTQSLLQIAGPAEE